jgi:PPOX class probable F420-dependent enzyme
MENKLSSFLDEKYINLETYKKDKTPIRTPVWFVIDSDIIYVITRENTGKVKRLKNNQNIQIVPCSFKGNPKNQWRKGTAQKVAGEKAEKAIKLRKKKYGLSATLAGLFSAQKGNPIVYSIQLND